MLWCTGAASEAIERESPRLRRRNSSFFLCGMYVQVASCDPCELQGLRQCYHQLPMTLSVFGSLQERVRCDVFPVFFFSLPVGYKFHVDVVYWFPMTPGVFRWLQERMRCRFGAVWKVGHEGDSSLLSRPDQSRRGHCDALCEGIRRQFCGWSVRAYHVCCARL